MRTKAIKAGYYETEYGKLPKIQILTIAELFAGSQPTLPWRDIAAFKKAERWQSKQGCCSRKHINV
jgi:hypothetical protein